MKDALMSPNRDRKRALYLAHLVLTARQPTQITQIAPGEGVRMFLLLRAASNWQSRARI